MIVQLPGPLFRECILRPNPGPFTHKKFQPKSLNYYRKDRMRYFMSQVRKRNVDLKYRIQKDKMYWSLLLLIEYLLPLFLPDQVNFPWLNN